MTDRHDRLYDRAMDILDRRHGIGLGEPILWHLALRNHGPAMLELANRWSRSGRRGELGRMQDAFSPLGLTRRAYRLGHANAAQNMAMTWFNIGDMAGYRLWLRRAAQQGDATSAKEARRFEPRMPHTLARRLRRLRPTRRDGT
ncbi:hypothetical protein NYR55_10900 [Sphingomonas sp. BGYR3]|uniref:hypothetical protein n=1 Tax=Sphingomonas sp. BGYR3 TaxID=2975483 RepID=UPI0021A5864C|nr:hypothetical protein [Sphingomonas sp. BGYR3]MDG5489121.1 hypothetical protein [Sphingomonas sp. BGYR3]